MSGDKSIFSGPGVGDHRGQPVLEGSGADHSLRVHMEHPVMAAVLSAWVSGPVGTSAARRW